MSFLNYRFRKASITKINIAEDFSRFPAGRFYEDGEFSAQRFREQLLVPALKNYDEVIVDTKGTLGYGSSFLQEAFAGLITKEGFITEKVLRTLQILPKESVYNSLITWYIKDVQYK